MAGTEENGWLVDWFEGQDVPSDQARVMAMAIAGGAEAGFVLDIAKTQGPKAVAAFLQWLNDHPFEVRPIRYGAMTWELQVRNNTTSGGYLWAIDSTSRITCNVRRTQKNGDSYFNTAPNPPQWEFAGKQVALCQYPIGPGQTLSIDFNVQFTPPSRPRGIHPKFTFYVLDRIDEIDWPATLLVPDHV
jgi:hypothetical protein